VSVSVVIPSWNGAHRLARLLPSLGESAQVIVVDNGSTDGTADLLSTRFPDADVLSLPRNEGFSRAVNRAARVARGDVLVLVNDDCVCESGFVEQLGRAIDPGRSMVMAAGVLLESGDPARVDSAGLEIDDTLLVFDYLNGLPTSALDSASPPFGPSGAAAAFDRSAFLEAGGFDEQLFAYWEDVDLTLRLRLEGALCAPAFGARAVHSHSATLGSGSARKNYLTGYGRGYLVRKWGVLRGAPVTRVLLQELAICAAQLAVDRTLSGISGRAAGWRAAPRAGRAYPAAVVRSGRHSVYAELRRRGGRRKRLGAARKPT
jgi:N-acetylglucosaminyl-diphospho-decaprenol L-rhamnosyltransferase